MTTHVPLSLRIAACLLAIAGLDSCTGSDSAGGTSFPDANSAGSGGTAGVPASTTTGSGGHTATSGGSGGVQPAGGSAGAGGASLTGGSSSNGGTMSTGGANGGTSSTGGSSATGGTTGTGGSRATGGTSNTGGSSPTGGTTPAGGSSNTGGSSARGGTTVAGGATTTGGTTNTGGSAGGSKPVGGTTGGTATGGTTTGGTTSAGGATGAGGSTHTGPWKIMALGDSITATTCYPQLLYQDLKNAGHTNFTFIGSVINNQGCGVTSPAGGFLTEGHSGLLVVTETNNGDVSKWLKANPPDIVVMHFATNDVWGNGDQATATKVIDAYTTVLSQLRAVNPNAIMFIAQIIPVNPSMNGCSSSKPCNFEATVDSLIPAWATSHSTTVSPVIAVNLETLYNNGYFSGSTYTSDGVHPTLTGSQPMGSTMAAAIIAKGYF